FTVHKDDVAKAETALEPVLAELGEGANLEATDGIAKLSVVGIGMRSHSGVAAEMFKALSEAGINIEMISTSEIKISVVVAERYMELAVRALHAGFELDAEPS
ncbi:MAG: ACT domain-containing protein, partial [Pseudomonadota bacterium]